MPKNRLSDRLLKLFDSWKAAGETNVGMHCGDCCRLHFARQVHLLLRGETPGTQAWVRLTPDRVSPAADDVGRVSYGRFEGVEDRRLLVAALGEIPLGRLLPHYPENYLELCLTYVLDGASPEERHQLIRNLRADWGVDYAARLGREVIPQLAEPRGPAGRPPA